MSTGTNGSADPAQVYIEELRATAVREIRRFAGADVERPQAAVLLELWRDCWKLSRASREAVLAEFPELSWEPKAFADYLPDDESSMAVGSSLKVVRR